MGCGHNLPVVYVIFVSIKRRLLVVDQLNRLPVPNFLEKKKSIITAYLLIAIVVFVGFDVAILLYRYFSNPKEPVAITDPLTTPSTTTPDANDDHTDILDEIYYQ